MPLVPTAAAYVLGIAKQTNESTVPGTAEYKVPVFSSTFGPGEEETTVNVTDASSIEGDPIPVAKWWEGEGEIPAFKKVTGRIIQGLWKTDTFSGGTHTFSALGGTQDWVAVYSNFTNASAEERMGKGLVSSFAITADADEVPARIRFGARGQDVVFGSWATATGGTEVLSDGYFTLKGGAVKADFDTPNSVPSSALTNVQNVTLVVDRGLTPIKTADSFTISRFNQGKVTLSGSMRLLYSDWDAYKATWFGAVAGTALSSTVVKGALQLELVDSGGGTPTLKFYVPSVRFIVAKPAPNPSGDALVQDVTLRILTPTSGDHIQPVLVGGAASQY